jgi:hypothetical protein
MDWHGTANDFEDLFIFCGIVFEIKKQIDVTICPYGSQLNFSLVMSKENSIKFLASGLPEKYRSKIKENSDISSDKISITCDDEILCEVIINFKDCN